MAKKRSPSKKAPAYMWYPKDFDSDEVVKMMTGEQEGAYRHLLDHQWLEGSLPPDPKKVALLALKWGPVERFVTEIWPSMAAKFVPRHDGRLINKRLERQRVEYDAFCKVQANNGLKGSAARWGRDGEPIATPLPSPSPTDGGSNGVAIHSPMAKNGFPISHFPDPISQIPDPREGTGQVVPDPPRRPPSGRSNGVFEGALPLKHGSHAACSLNGCVHQKVHDVLAAELATKFHDDTAAAARALVEWYPSVLATIPDGHLMGDAFAFLRPHFNAKWADPPPTLGRPSHLPSTRDMALFAAEKLGLDPTKVGIPN